MTRKRFWPDPTQALLLGVCLHRDREAAIQSWKKWKARVDLDDLDNSSFQIMSLVCRRLLDLDIADPDLRRIKGLHRYRWTQNQLATRGQRELLKALHRENIPTMLLNGAALGRTVYPEPTTRGMQDMEILVPRTTAANAMQRLEKQGWISRHIDAIRTVEYSYACPLLHPDYGEVCLYWRVMRSEGSTGRDEELWQAARDFAYEETPTHVLCPADQFLHGCEQGMYHPCAPDLQWLVDGTFVVRHSPAPFDWPRLVDQSRKFQRSLHTRATLIYLREHFEDSIPGEAIAELAQAPVTLDNRIEYFLAGRPEARRTDLTHKLGRAARRYLNLKPGERRNQLRHDLDRKIGYFLAGRPEAKQTDLTHKLGMVARRYLKLKPEERRNQFRHDLDRRIEYFLAGRPEAKQSDLRHKLGRAIWRYLKLKPEERRNQLRHDFPRFWRLVAPPLRALRSVYRKILSWRKERTAG